MERHVMMGLKVILCSVMQNTEGVILVFCLFWLSPRLGMTDCMLVLFIQVCCIISWLVFFFILPSGNSGFYFFYLEDIHILHTTSAIPYEYCVDKNFSFVGEKVQITLLFYKVQNIIMDAFSPKMSLTNKRCNKHNLSLKNWAILSFDQKKIIMY